MFNNAGKILMVFLAGFFVTGCAATRTETRARKVETRFYAEDRPRVDQEMKGNFGYIMGTPKPEDRSEFRKTRRVYVLEVVQNVEEALNMPEVKIEPYVPAPAVNIPPRRERREPVQEEWAKPLVLPAISDTPPASRSVQPSSQGAAFEDYVIQSGDTLQKISKKFYGSYSQWTKIYDANKDVLKDPNRIREGVRIRIPLAGSGSSSPAENLK